LQQVLFGKMANVLHNFTNATLIKILRDRIERVK